MMSIFIKYIIEVLASDEKLDIKLKDHRLISDKNYDNVRECHIEPDWLLIYKIEEQVLLLKLIRTGKHSDLFKQIIKLIITRKLNIFL